MLIDQKTFYTDNQNNHLYSAGKLASSHLLMIVIHLYSAGRPADSQNRHLYSAGRLADIYTDSQNRHLYSAGSLAGKHFVLIVKT